jgi:hypothetical protein
MYPSKAPSSARNTTPQEYRAKTAPGGLGSAPQRAPAGAGELTGCLIRGYVDLHCRGLRGQAWMRAICRFGARSRRAELALLAPLAAAAPLSLLHSTNPTPLRLSQARHSVPKSASGSSAQGAVLHKRTIRCAAGRTKWGHPWHTAYSRVPLQKSWCMGFCVKTCSSAYELHVHARARDGTSARRPLAWRLPPGFTGARASH